MDPSGFDQTPPTPPPPPPAPGWTQPEQPGPYGQPGQPGPYGQPGQPDQHGPYGQPPGTWTAPAPAPRSPLRRIIAAVVVLLIIAGGVFAFASMTSHPADAGKVVFSTDKPVEGQTIGCTVDHQVTTIPAGTSVYATYIFTSRQGSSVASLSITKDGASFLPPTELPTSDTQGLDCFADTTDLSTIFEAGTYVFTLTSNGNTIAQGTLVVTP